MGSPPVKRGTQQTHIHITCLYGGDIKVVDKRALFFYISLSPSKSNDVDSMSCIYYCIAIRLIFPFTLAIFTYYTT